MVKPEYVSRPSWGAAGTVAPKRARRYGPTLDDVPDDELTPPDEYPGRVAELRSRLHMGTTE
jgi:hypothetical protein